MNDVKDLAVALQQIYLQFAGKGQHLELNEKEYDLTILTKVAPSKVGLKSAKKDEMVKIKLQARGYTIDDQVWLDD
eukprot:UN14882